MALYKNVETGKVIEVPEEWKLVSVWKKIDKVEKEENLSNDKQIFSSVKELKEKADTSKVAYTERGAEYVYEEEKWVKSK